MCCTGTAWIANCAPAIASAALVVAFTLGGSEKSWRGGRQRRGVGMCGRRVSKGAEAHGMRAGCTKKGWAPAALRPSLLG